jgi:hypothetical protein
MELLADMIQLRPTSKVRTRLFRMLFLSRLPIELRIIHAEDGASSLQDFAARANVLWWHSSGQQSSFALAAVEAEESSTVAAVGRTDRRSNGRGGNNGSWGRGGAQHSEKAAAERKKQLDSGFCYSHWKYGTQAYPEKCKKPCAWVAEN